jgi:hypothetical protein
MTATVKPSEGFFRAVCKAEECRADNRQRNYWQTPHMKPTGAATAAAKHNQERHAGEPS